MGKRSSQVLLRKAQLMPRVSASNSAMACSARCTPTVPLALVKTTSLSTNSGQIMPSIPAPHDWIQRSRAARWNASRLRLPKATSISGATSSTCCGDSASTIST